MSSTQNQEGGDEQCESEHNVSGCRYEPGRPAWARRAHPLDIWCVRQHGKLSPQPQYAKEKNTIMKKRILSWLLVLTICELFAPTEDGTIHVENIPFEPSSYIPTLPGPFGQLSQPQKTEEDYKEELEEFIASSSGCGYYEFNIANLRPGECRWFSHGMLIKPVNGIIKVHYQIHSARSMGDLEGTLEMNTD